MTTKKQLENTLTWYTYYTDYIEKHFYNIHNEAAEFSDDRQKLENEFLQFPQLEEEEEDKVNKYLDQNYSEKFKRNNYLSYYEYDELIDNIRTNFKINSDEVHDLADNYLDKFAVQVYEEEFIKCRECTEEAEQDSYFCSDSCAEDYKNNLRFDREKEEN